jgi:hypothetical protein
VLRPRVILIFAMLWPFAGLRASTCRLDFAALKADLGLTSRQLLPLMDERPVGRLVPSRRAGGGTTGGKWYRDEAGEEWFVKTDGQFDELQSAAEVISAKIYGYLGYRTPVTAIVEIEGRRAVAVKSLGRDLEGTTLDAENDTYFRQLHYFAALLKDWDRLRWGPNNVYLPGDRSYALLDFGGSLGSRAQGRHKPGKPFSDAIGVFENDQTGREIVDSFRTSDLPEGHPWKQELGDADRRAVARKLRLLRDEVLEHIVRQADYRREADSLYMLNALKARRDALLAYLDPRQPSTPPRSEPARREPRAAEPFSWDVAAGDRYMGEARLTERERMTLDDFVNDRTYWWVNPVLNNRPYGRDVEVLAYGQVVRGEAQMRRLVREKIIPGLDSAIEKQRALPPGLKLYRGKVTSREVGTQPLNEIFEEPSYQSTSISENSAQFYITMNQMGYEGEFSGGSSEPYTVLLQEFIVRGDNAKGIFVPKALRGYGENTANNRSEIEGEMLLARDQKFRVVDRKVTQQGRRTVVIETVEILGRE